MHARHPYASHYFILFPGLKKFIKQDRKACSGCKP